MKTTPIRAVIVSAVLILIQSCDSKQNTPQSPTSGVRIEVKSAIVWHDTAVNACVSIINDSNTQISIFPPEYGSVLPASYYGFATNTDTIWFDAATDMDYDTYPEVVIPAHFRYTFKMRPGFFELWYRGVNVKSDSRLRHLINSAKSIRVRYLTALIDSLRDDSDPIDSASVRKYQRFKLESTYAKITSIESPCDTGIKKY